MNAVEPALYTFSLSGIFSFIGPNLAWFIFLATLIAFVVYTAILLYHWLEYEKDAPYMWLSMLIYLAVTLFLITILFFITLSIA